MAKIRIENNNVLVNKRSRIILSPKAPQVREFFRSIKEATIVVCENPDNLLTPSFVDAATHHVSIIRSTEGTHIALGKDAVPLPDDYLERSLLLLQARRYEGRVIHEIFHITPRLPSEMADEEDEE